MKFLKLVFFLAILLSCTTRSIPPRVGVQRFADGFTSPVALVDPNDGSQRLFVVDQTGLIWIIFDGKQIEKPFIDLRERVVELNSFYEERGLLGLAFHPDFADNGRFYVSYSGQLQNGSSTEEWDHTTYISEFTISAGDPEQADPNS